MSNNYKKCTEIVQRKSFHIWWKNMVKLETTEYAKQKKNFLLHYISKRKTYKGT